MGKLVHKKIRGWKKQVKKIDAWYIISRIVNFDYFNRYAEDYTKVRIDPWNRLCERVPPQWYFRLIIEALIKIYTEWKKEYQMRGTAFDLQLWLNDPNTIRSEIVCAKVSVPGEKREDYYRRSSDKITFPHQKWGSKNYNLQAFEWTLFDDENFHFTHLESLDEAEINSLLKNGFISEQIIVDGKEETRYSKKVGHVWVGRMKD